MERGTTCSAANAYELQDSCANYVMCIDGRTRVSRMSEGGREMLIYKVGAGGTCVLTTQYLLSDGGFQAQSIAEARTELAALPADTFRRLMRESDEFRDCVLDAYTRLLSAVFDLVEEVAFAPLERRLARCLLVEADAEGIVWRPISSLPPTSGACAR